MDTLLISKIRTAHERDNLVTAIDLLEQSQFQSKGGGFEEVLRSKVPAWASEIIRKEMTSPAYLTEIKKALNALVPLKLIIAFQPTESSIDKLSEYVKGKYILDFEYDPKIIGGAVIISKGLLRDYSIRKTIWKTLENI